LVYSARRRRTEENSATKISDGFAAFSIALASARNDDDDTLPKPDGRGVKSVVKVLLQRCRGSTSLHRRLY
jgi:hypothetical protein